LLAGLSLPLFQSWRQGIKDKTMVSAAAGAAGPLITGGFFSEVIENCQTEQHKRK
jgi:hypothetical protein